MKLVRTKNNPVLLRSQKELLHKDSITEYWELNNQLELIVVKYDPDDVSEYKDRCDITVWLPKWQLTQEIFDHLITIDKYKDVLRLIVTLFDSKWIIVPKNLCASIMQYIETLDVRSICGY